MICQTNSPLGNAGAATRFFLGTPGGGNGPRRTLLQFATTAVPAGSTITRVRLTLDSVDIPADNTITVTVHRITQNWNEGSKAATTPAGGQQPLDCGNLAAANESSWNQSGTGGAWTAGGSHNATASATRSVNGTFAASHTWDSSTAGNGGLVTDFQAWLNGTAGNFGWLLKSDSAPAANIVALQSPTLIIDYDPPLTITKSGTGGGTVTSTPAGISCGATCSASFTSGSTVTLSAAASAGSMFTGWSGSGCSGTGACGVTMSAARNVTATFELLRTLTVSKAGSGTGTVTSNPAGINCGADCTEDYANGTAVTLSAAAAAGSVFTGWSGSGCSGTGTCAVTMSAARSVTATFEALRTLTVSKSGSGSGTVTSNPAGVSCGADCTEDYLNGTVVTLSAVATAGSAFTGWSGSGCSGTGTCVVTMSAARAVTATFELLRTLTVSKAGSGTGTVTSSPAGISCGADCTEDYFNGTVVTLSAAAAAGSVFTGWSGSGCSGTGNCVVTMSAARAVTATFELLRTLTVSRTGSGTGTVTSSPTGISCGADCTEDYANGTVVTLSAVANAGSVFTGWSGEGCSGTGTCVVTMSAARSVTANFELLRTLTVSRTGSGTGTVTSSPAGISCGADCTEDYANGTVATLSAAANAGSVFTGWSGEGCSGTGTCVVTMSAARSVTANFELLRTLTVAKDGTGAGTVTSAPAGINCGVTCAADYANATVVTLTAAAGAGSVFTGWAGEGCTGTGSCVVTMSAARSVTATFELLRTLTVTKIGSGAGTVTSDAAGIDCGADCTEDYANGTMVTLSAAASAGSVFTGWSGAGCTGTGACVVTMTAARSVTATLELLRTLTVTKSGTGTGTVTSTPAGIDCGADCTEDYANGTVVTLSAAASAGSVFTGWSGAGCTGSGACVVTMSAARGVTATFELLRTLTVTKSGTGAGTVTSAPAGIDCGADCTEDYANGTVVTLSAAASAGAVFTGWAGAGCAGTGTCVVTMTAARNVSATFEALRTLSVSKSGTGAGTVTSSPPGISCGATCTADYVNATVVTLSAAADAGSVFTGWSGAGCAGTGTCVVTMTAARSVTATFELLRTLSVSKSGGGGGIVTSSPAGIDCGATCTGDYVDATVVTLSAAADTGSVFTGWSGEGCAGTGTCVVTMSAARSITATFELLRTLSVVRIGSGAGTVTSSPAGIDCGADCTEDYVNGTVVTLSAAASAGSVFTGWSGEGCAGTGTCVVTMTAARNVSATFELLRTLTVTRNGTGAGTVTSSPAGINCGADCTEDYPNGTVVTLSAATGAGSVFTGWTGAGCAGTETCVVTMTAARSVTAAFELLRTLTVTKAGTGAGTVTSAPAGVDCGADCTEDYANGTVVTLSAAASAGSVFTGWAGAGCAGTGTCVVTMTAARSVTATFELLRTLTVTKTGSGAGTVTSSPAGIDCGATCTASYVNGTLVTLSAMANAGSVFTGWSGAGCAGTGTCVVTMTQARSVTATFELLRTLTVTKAGTGAGTVTSSPAGVDCGADCTESYPHGTVVTLSTVASAGSMFTGWSGEGCSGTGTCVVTMTLARSVTATFELLRTLTVTTAGTGTGTVTSSPAGISCGADCTEDYINGTLVTLSSAASAGSVFTGWSGEGCAGTGTCVVTMTAARSVTATFELLRTLTVTKTGSGAGTVTSSPAGIDCGATCTASYVNGTLVTLSAMASAGSVFTGWSGEGCAGTGTCVVTMSAARSVTASFELLRTLTVTKNGSGDGTVTSVPAGINCGMTCSAEYANATGVTLSAAANAGSVFTGWSGEGCAGTGTCVVTMTQARGVTATFTALRTLTVSKNGTGSGTVTSSPAGIDCGASCSADLVDATVVTLSAAASAGSVFTGWSGESCSGTGTCVVTMSVARSVTATFELLRTLTVTRNGSGAGTVTSAPAGINCGTTCAADYANATVVTLSAVASAGSVFSGWSGEGCAGTGTCVVTMTAARNVTATFELLRALTVSKTGTGAGTVTSTPAGIDCGAACSASYANATVVTLSAAASAGSLFTGWSGEGCAGTGTCVVTMTQARSVSATFELLRTLTVARNGSGSGTVTSAPAGINCGATCAADYANATVVTLSAAASAGSVFTGWSGEGCAGTGTCVVTMSAARSVTATFETLRTLTVTKNGSGAGTVTSAPAGISCGLTCSASYANATVVTLSAAADPGSVFTGWAGESCAGTGTCVVTMTAARSVTATFEALRTLTVTKSGSGTGTVTSSPAGIDCGATCSADYANATVVTLSAAASAGSVFTGWSGEGCAGTGTCVVTMTAARNVTATFELLRTLTVTRNGTGTGTVTSSPPGIDCGASCTADYANGTVVTLSAVAGGSSVFSGWSGSGCAGTGACVVTMTQARNVTATFTALRLSVLKAGLGGGTVTSSPAGISCGADCTEDYASGTVVTLSAVADAGSQFIGWSGEGCAGTGTCVVTMTTARTVTATFNPPQILTVVKAGSGTGTVSSNPAGIDCGATCSFQFQLNEMVTLSAVAGASSVFGGWSGEGCSGTGSCVVTMDTARSVTATFTALRTLTVSRNGSGAGTVTSSPAGITCGGDCTEDYLDGTVVTLSAAASAGSVFTGWSGAGCAGTGTCVVTMTAARSVTATFELLRTLTISRTGGGTGTVTSNPAGINCGGDCTEDYANGTVVTLSAAASAGSVFTGWSGEGCTGTGSCVVTMSAARSVTATFALLRTLTVTRNGTGTGTVTSLPAGINCGATCTASYTNGTVVTLSAAASAGSVFTGWAGEGCTGTGSCVVTMSAARSVTATFELLHMLTVSKNGSGTGTVTSSPAGVDCGADCTESYINTTVVTLSAAADPGSVFTGWAGEGCAGTGTCVVTMTTARNVTATFELLRTLTVTRSGTGAGTVTSAPAGINCGADCTEDYANGTVVTLSAAASAGSVFTGWSGEGCAGTGTCVVTMTAARNVTATFELLRTLTVTKAGSGAGTVTSNPAGISCGATCAASYANGTVVTLSAVATAGSVFTGWSGEGCAGTGTCVVTMTAARNVTATFELLRTLTVSTNGSGTGTVSSNPAGINCGADCTEDYLDGTVVTLIAAPGAGSVFGGWAGAGCSGTESCVVTMSAARSVTATFEAVRSLTVSKAGTGGGTVTSNPPGIDCGVDCSEGYVDTTVVTLSAAAAAGSLFTGWSGEGCAGTGSCVVTMSAARSVTATFELLRTLTVTKAGSGTGTVTSSPAGISCGGDCTEAFVNGTVVTIGAVAAVDAVFTGWSGAGCSGTGACVVTMTGARNVTATFAALRTLTVIKSGSGAGTVTSSPAGISCGGDCTEDYVNATVVTLSAVVSAGSVFIGWSGEGCAGTGTCVVTMTAARSVTATFELLRTLTVTKSGSGAGTVTSSPAGISCGVSCTADYANATVVTLSAATSAGSVFSGWSGEGCAGTGTCVVTMTAARSVTATFELLRTLTVTRNGSGAGTVTSNPAGINCGATCSASYVNATVVTLTAAASAGSVFAGWSGEGCAGTGTCVVTMTAARGVTATFTALRTLTVSKNGTGSGTVTSSPAGIDCGASCSADFVDATVVTLSAVAGGSSLFTGWSGEGCAGTGTCVVTMTAARSVTATFEALRTLTVTKSGSGAGTVTSNPAGINCGATCSADYANATVVTLSAAASAGSVFTGWSGEGCAGTGTCVVTMTAARNVTATFELLRTLAVTRNGTGSGTVTSSPPGIDCGASCTADYANGTVVTLSAVAGGSSVFSGWSGSGCAGTGTCVVTMTAARNVTATFEALRTLSTSTNGTGAGTVTSTPAGINCGADCTEDYVDGTAVTLIAAPGAGSVFTGWTGAGCAGTGTCVVTMTQAAAVTATFELQRMLTVSKDGTGTGTVTSEPTGITCGTDCTEVYADGVVVTLSAAADTGSVFSGWSGEGCSGTGTCVVTMDTARSVTATFTALRTLTVSRNGSGAGTVTSSPAGITCGADCTEDYLDGTVVTLSAAASAGSVFTGWSGAGCAGTGACVVTMTQARSVTATFELLRTLTVTRSGGGTGTVTSSPAGIDCGGDCTEDYANGTVVTLSAAASAGSVFTGWSGEGCTGTGTCVVTMSAARSVTATFALLRTLTVSRNGTGTGTVTSLPAGINCGADCTEDYLDGKVVTLTAAPGAGSAFTSWTGAGCAGTGTCVVTMSTARSVTATFELLHMLTVSKNGSGTGTVTSAPAGIDCGGDCTESYVNGTVVTLSAAADPGSVFTGWAGEGCAGTGSCVVTMTAARGVTATFELLRTLMVTRNGSGQGTVTSAPAGINCGADCTEDYANGTVVTLSAAASAGSVFTGWPGEGCAGTGTCIVTMTAARNVTATFELLRTLTVTRNGTGAGTVTSNPAGISCGATCAASYANGTVVTLSAVATAGSVFTGWSGEGCSGTGTCAVTMTAARNVTATFELLRTLTVTKAGTGAGTVTSAPAGITCGVTCSASYTNATMVTLSAAANAGSVFTGWSGEGCTGTSTCVVTMSAARAVTATFELLRPLTVTKAGTGTGTVTSSPAGIECGVTCSASYANATVATLSALASGTSQFSGWSGEGCTGTGTCVVTMSQARTVTATFAPPQTLTVLSAGTGAGTVTSNPAGITCGASCSAPFQLATVVTLSAAADASSRFTGWSGAGCSGTGACQVTVDLAKSVTATFAALRTLTVTKNGAGSGTVSSAPPGVSCGADCAEDYLHDTVVTLSPAPDAGSAFSGWSGAGCTGTDTCVVTMSAAREVSASFGLDRTLTVTLAGDGSGNVTSAPPGIDCGSDCTEAYLSGTSVTLSATPSTGSTFSGFSGACTGTICTVTLDAAAAVTATFARIQRTLSVTTAGTGAGTVTSAPAGIDCGATCAADFDQGTVVTLLATPDPDSAFAGWTGDCANMTGPCILTLDAARSVTAIFGVATITQSVSLNPSRDATICDDGSDPDAGTSNGRGALFVGLTDTAGGFPAERRRALVRFDLGSIPAGARVLSANLQMTVGRSMSPAALINLHRVQKNWGEGSSVAPGSCAPAAPGDASWTNACTAPGNAGCTAQPWAAPGGDFLPTSSAAATAAGTGSAPTWGSTAALVTDVQAWVNTPVQNFGWILIGPENTRSAKCFVSKDSVCPTANGPTAIPVLTVTFESEAAPVLSVAKSGAGSGTVTGTPAGISCGAICAQALSTGSTVTLSAAPATGSTFAGWAGGGCAGTGTCVVTVNAATSVTAAFDTNDKLLSVVPFGSGSGTVTSAPAGIDCGSACERRFPTGTRVTLTATPAHGSRFDGWAGACTNPKGVCLITLGADATAAPTFTLTPFEAILPAIDLMLAD